MKNTIIETANHEHYVSLEIANLLKEVGFNWTCRGYFDNTEFHPNGSVECTNYNSSTCKYLKVPVLEVAQRWLREVKNLILLIDITPSYCNGKPMGYKFVIHVSGGNHIWGEWKDTYEEALEAGIKKALEIILEIGK